MSIGTSDGAADPVVETRARAEPVVPRALDYPYLAPLERYVFALNDAAPPFAIENRTPVLALGSNAAPSQLRRKFAELPGHIPVSRAVLFDHTVVYSAHFTRYGSLPATLYRHAGALAFVAITWLDARQLARMHETESVGINYDYVEINDARLEHDGGLEVAGGFTPAGGLAQGVGLEQGAGVRTGDRAGGAPLPIGSIGAYVSRRGPLLHQGRPIRLAETASSGCPLPALTQPAALRFAQRRVAPDMPFEAFIERLVSDADFRAASTGKLATQP